MGTKERRRRQIEETRDKILHAARDLFLERGYEEVTMRAIAQAIEYTPTAIYHHFENKQALVTELCHSDFGHLARHFLKAASIADPIERIRAIGEAYLEFAILYPNHYRFMFMTRFPFVVHMESGHQDDPEVDAYAFLRRVCEEAILQNRLRPDITDAQELAQIIWGSLHGLISLDLLKSDKDRAVLCDLKTTARKTLEILLRGMLRDAEG